ncbi:mechanosensitive ion channel [Candidatus Peregrinibacteria bacterium]|nr:mechanosensitive ion channel [Candidatus Peregrinibacteria bacterium]
MAEQITTTNVPTERATGSSGGINFANIGPYIIEKLIQVLEAALILVAVYFLIRYFKKYLRKLVVEHEQQKTAINLFEKLITGFIVVIGITLSLRTVGIDMTLLVSVTILGLSYGLQDIIKNYVAGILIMFKSPFKLGDTINIKGHTGKVDKIDFQSTTLRTFDQKDVTIYNSDVMTQSIINFSRSSIRRVEITITLGYGSDYLKAIKIFDNILRNHPLILKKPSHKILFQKFSDLGIKLDVRAWVNFPANILAIKSDLALKFSEAFNEKDIFIPYGKGIEIDSDYTLSENRQNKLTNSEQKPAFQVGEVKELPMIGELIDFEEIE